jgi:hypothetical protein
MLTFTEALAHARYVVDAQGEKTEVLLPLSTWTELLMTWKQLVELLEDQEDAVTLQQWLEQRTAGTTDTISLDTLEQELRSDGLL